MELNDAIRKCLTSINQFSPSLNTKKKNNKKKKPQQRTSIYEIPRYSLQRGVKCRGKENLRFQQKSSFISKTLSLYLGNATR